MGASPAGEDSIYELHAWMSCVNVHPAFQFRFQYSYFGPRVQPALYFLLAWLTALYPWLTALYPISFTLNKSDLRHACVFVFLGLRSN